MVLKVYDVEYSFESIEALWQEILTVRDEALAENDFNKAILFTRVIALLAHLAGLERELV